MSAPNPDLAKLTAAAEAGDPQAQYDLAAHFHAQRQLEPAMAWTQRAARAGHRHAQYTLGAFALSGAIPLQTAHDNLLPLKDAADHGVVQAQRLMSVVSAWGLLGREDWSSAAAYLVEAAKAGDPGAVREAGILIAMEARDLVAGRNLLVLAASLGDPLAAKWAQHTTASPVSWPEVLRRLQSVADEHESDPVALCAAPNARVQRQFFRKFECDYLCVRSTAMVQRSQVVDQSTGKGKLDADRTSSVFAIWPVYDDLPMHRLNRRMAAAANLPWRHGEILNVMRYESGQEYKPHFDFFAGNMTTTPTYLAEGGQRIRTVLVYLNEGYDGGETCFIPANIRYKGATGDALIFDNVDAAGAPDRSSLHAGLPVTQGVKWLASKWFRAGPHW